MTGTNSASGKTPALRKLEDEVHMLRSLVISLMRPDIREVLNSYVRLEDRDAVSAWMNDAADKLIDLADKRPSEEMGEYRGTGHRAYCPLCNDGARGPAYAAEGFAWPEGLRRHLLGEGNSIQCGVAKAARNKAISYTEVEIIPRLRTPSRPRTGK